MKLLRTTVWPWYDIALLKWCCLLIGMIAGAYFADFVKAHVWAFVIASVLLAMRPWRTYFGRDDMRVKC